MALREEGHATKDHHRSSSDEQDCMILPWVACWQRPPGWSSIRGCSSQRQTSSSNSRFFSRGPSSTVLNTPTSSFSRLSPTSAIPFCFPNCCPDFLQHFWSGHASTHVSERYTKLLKDREFRLQWAEKIGMGFTLPTPSSGLRGLLIPFRKVG